MIDLKKIEKEQDLLKRIELFLEGKEDVYLFGAGHFGLITYGYLVSNNLSHKIKGFVVSGTVKEEKLVGLPILSISTFTELEKATIILTLSEKYQSDVIKLLERRGNTDYYIICDEEFAILEQKSRIITQDILEISSNAKKRHVIHYYREILVIKLDGIGDMILCIPFFRELRRNYPGAKISVITSQVCRDIINECPYVDEVYICDIRKYMGYPLRFMAEYAASFMEVFQKDHEVQLAIVPRFGADWYGAGLLAYYSGAGIRVSYSEMVVEDKRIGNEGFDLFYTDVFDDQIPKNEALKNLDLITFLGGKVEETNLELWDTQDSVNKIQGILSVKHWSAGDKVIVFGLSGSGENKRWKESNFLTLIDYLHELDDNIKIVLCGDPYNDMIINSLNFVEKEYVLNLCGKIDLLETVSLMKKAFLYIGNDTGIMHMAAACNCLVIELNCKSEPVDDSDEYGSVRFVPWNTKYCLLRPTIGGIDNISVEEVLKSIKLMLDSEE